MTIIEFMQMILLSILQGITEPIPVSSSGHLQILGNIMDLDILNDTTFMIVVNAGSLIAITYYYFDDIKELFTGFFKYVFTRDSKYYNIFRYCLLLVVATIPAGLCGLLFNDAIESIFSNIKYVGLSLLITALFLYFIKDKDGTKSDYDITFKDALIIGLFQMVALMPGISRSGSTIVGCMLLGLSRKSALKFSFLLYIPISVATVLLGITEIDFGNTSMLIGYGVSIIVSMITTYFMTKVFVNIMNSGKLIYFVYYCILLGSFTLIFLS